MECNFGNTCALICRFVLLILLICGIILSSMVVPSCHFIAAITPKGEPHGVGLQSFEDEAGTCVPHNSFVKNNYNGNEMAAKVGGYLAPTFGSIVILFLIVECCKTSIMGYGKCIPSILILGSIICQGITFLLFQSELFCSNKDIAKCDLGDAAYRSIQACLVYGFCGILYYCGPTPIPFSPPQVNNNNNNKASRVVVTHSTAKKKKKKQQQQRHDSDSDDSYSTRSKKKKKKQHKEQHHHDDDDSSYSRRSKEKRKKKKPKSEPGPDEEWTKEMYEQRRKEKKVKSRGVSGRSKKEIFDERHGNHHGSGGRGGSQGNTRGRSVRKDDIEGGAGGGSDKKQYENSIVSYDPRQYEQHRDRSPQSRFDDYVDTDPDGMDWSAYTPDQREAYYERERRKKRERKERERNKREQQRDLEQGRSGGDRHGSSPRSPNSPGEDYSQSYADSYTQGGDTHYDDDYTQDESYYSVIKDGRQTAQQYQSDGGGRGGDYGDYGSPGSNTRDSRDYDRRSPRSGRGGGGDDYSYAQDSYAQDSYAQDTYDESHGDYRSREDFSYADEEHQSPPRSSSRRGGGGGGRSERHNDSYYDDSYSASYDDRRGYRDDPSFA
ncbi:hypothetical protein ACHAXR_009183 [Thalassiosira sp. AJA248-18]